MGDTAEFDEMAEALYLASRRGFEKFRAELAYFAAICELQGRAKLLEERAAPPRPAKENRS